MDLRQPQTSATPSSEVERDAISRRNVLAGMAAVPALTLVGVGTASDPSATFQPHEMLADFDRFGDPPAIESIVRQWRALPPISALAWTPLQGDWFYAPGKKAEGLQARVEQIPADLVPVKLEHRVLEPDTPLWYRASLDVDTPSVLRVDADDGAHLFVNGNRIAQKDGVFYLPAQPKRTAELVVRVLNKAVYGGLVRLAWCSTGTFEGHSEAASLRSRLDFAVSKLRRLVRPSRRTLTAARAAVNKPDAQSIARFEDSMRGTPLMTIGPVVHSDVPEQAVVAWETDVEVKPRLHYRTTNQSPREARIESSGNFYRAFLDRLLPDTSYAYRIENGASIEEVRHFRTLPDHGPLRFTVWGDSHIGGKRFRQNVGAMLMEESAFTVGVGDLVVDASNHSPWVRFFEIGAPLFSSMPVFFLGGNHDYDDCFEDLNSEYYNRYARLNREPFHAWTVANCRFVALDPNIQFPTGIDSGSPQHRWLLKELASKEWKQATWRFLFVHQPPYGQGWTDYSGDLPVRSLLDELIPEYKIDFVISGHIHDYERLTKTYGEHKCTFLVVGGAGGGLEDGPMTPEPKMDKVIVRHHYGRFTVDDERVLFDAFSTDTLLMDRIEVKR